MPADRSVLVRLRANVSDFNRNIATSSAAVGTLESRLRSADKEGGASIDRLSGRLKVLADLAAILGPAFAPIGAVAVPAVTGLAAQIGFATTGALGFIIAVQGVGGALEAMNKAHLEPTTENLAAARIEMEKLSPAGQDLTRQIFGLRDEWRHMRDVSQGALFPGLSTALDELEDRLPDVERILANVNEAVGELLSGGAESLGSERWDDFFEFIATDAPPALAGMASALGNVAHAMSELWMAFDPLNDDFSTWLVDSTAQLDEWAQGLSRTQGFQDFVDYIRESGPQVAETLGAVSMAVLDIVEAAAPLGGPVLAALEAVADTISTIADSDAGPAIMATVTALALLRRSMATLDAVQATSWAQGIKGAETFGGKVAAARTPILRTSAALGGLALASSDAADGFLLSNTATGAMLGMLGGPWGAAVGGAVGLMLDLSKSTGSFKVNTEELTATLDQQTGAITRNTAAYAAQQLENQGVLQAAQDLGLSLSDVTQASLGNADALARVKVGLDAAKEGFYNADGSTRVGTETLQKYGEQSFFVMDAIGGMSGELQEGQGRVRRMADATDASAASMSRAETAAQDFADAVTRLNNVLERRATVRDYEAAIDDLAASIKENGRTFDVTTEKGRNNQAALDNIANTAIRLAENMKGADRQRVLTAAIKDLREAGNKFDIPKAQTQALIELLRKANNARVDPSIDANTSPAMAKINALEARLRAIRDEDVFINVRQIGSTTLGPRPGVADGGTIPGTRQPYGDKALYALAPGEEVISNRFGQADRHRPLLKAINGGLAGGGTAGMSSGWGGLSNPNGTRSWNVPNQGWGGLAPDDFGLKGDLVIARTLEKFARQALKASERQLEAAETSFNAAVQQRDNVQQMRDSLLSSVAGQFSGSLTGGGLAGLARTLAGDIAGGSQMSSILKALVGAGLDTTGPAAGLFQELAASNDLATVSQLLNAGPDAISFFEQQFVDRASINQGRGEFVADASFGAQLAASQETVRLQQEQLDAAQAEARQRERQHNQLVRETEKLREAVQEQADRIGKVLNGVAADAGRNAGPVRTKRWHG